MPTLSIFHGIKIRLYWDDHPPPHFHADAGESRAVFEIETLRLLRGDLPPDKTALVRMGRDAPDGTHGGVDLMLETNTAEQDLPAAVEAKLYTAIGEGGRTVRCNVPWLVVRVKALPKYQLSVEFIDGTAGLVEMRELIFSDHGGVFKSLQEPAAFAAVSCEEGHVEWANGVDIAPDATHEDFLKYGVQILR